MASARDCQVFIALTVAMAVLMSDGTTVAAAQDAEELAKSIRDMKSVMYGNGDAEPVPEACAQLIQEFFKDNTLRRFNVCLPKLNLEACKDATQVVVNLQRHQLQSRLIACNYLEANKYLMDTLVLGKLAELNGILLNVSGLHARETMSFDVVRS